MPPGSRKVNDLSWMIGGPQGSGVDSADGAIIYDPSLGSTKVADVPTIDRRASSDLRAYLNGRGLGETVNDMLTAAKQRGIALVPVPFHDLLEQVAEEFKVDQLRKIARMVNMLAVGASFGALRFDFGMLEKA